MNRVTGYVKLGLIPVLAGVLFLVLRPGATSSTISTTNIGPASPIVAAPTVEAETTNQQAEKSSSHLIARAPQPTFTAIRHEDIAHIDPFDRRMIFPEKEPANTDDSSSENDDRSLVSSLEAKSKSTETLKVQVVFQTRTGISAMLDDRIIRVGDLLEDGRQVIQITPECLVLAPPTIH